MTGAPETFVDTPLGGLLVWANDGDSIGVATLGPRDKQGLDHRDNPDAQRAAEHVTLHGVAYTLRLHLRRADTPDPHRSQSEHRGWRLEHLGLTRADDLLRDGTPAVDRHVREVLFPALIAWLHSDPGRALLATAGRHAAAAHLARLDADIAKLQAELARLRAERARAATAVRQPDHR